MGLRAVGLTLTNCGNKTYRLNGYPEVSLFDEDGSQVKVKVRHDGTEVGLPQDRPKPLSVRPGETAISTMSWRNTVTFGDVERPALLVAAPDAETEGNKFPLDVDLGTTGRITLTSWRIPPPGS
jgi:hypothetical protein